MDADIKKARVALRNLTRQSERAATAIEVRDAAMVAAHESGNSGEEISAASGVPVAEVRAIIGKS